MTIDEEFKLLKEYMQVYIQLLPECVHIGGKRIYKPQLPTFQEFKDTCHDPRYSLSMPHYKEAYRVYDKNRIGPVHTQGLGSESGIGYRYYNYWMGCKFYTDSLQGEFTIETEEVNQALKTIKS